MACILKGSMSFKTVYLLLFCIGLMLVSFTRVSATVKFTPNNGQWESEVLYKADIPGGSMYVERDGITYFFYDVNAIHDHSHKGKPLDKVQCHVVKIKFEEGQGVQQVEELIKSKEYYNYFIGNEPSKWASGVHNYKTLLLKDVWKGIDIRLDGQEDGVKYDFIVHAKGRPENIKLRYMGADDMLLKEGALHVTTTLGNILEDVPYAYQKGLKKEIDAEFILEGNLIGFHVQGYNRSEDLIIDPTVVFATFSGSFADNWGFTATYDHEGNAYAGGTVYNSGFPTQAGSFQMNFRGGNNQSGKDLARDAGILKFSPDGKQLLWGTYLGGSHNEQPHSMVVNSQGELLVMGTTMSSNFPMSSGANLTHSGEYDIYIVKLSSDGTQLLSSSFLGGSGSDGINDDPFSNNFFNYKYTDGALSFNYGDAYRGEINIDSKDNVYIASCTRSINFPVVNGFQTKNNGGLQDGCVAKFSPDLSEILWSTYLGGSGQDAVYGVNFDLDSNVIVTGGTKSNNFPVTSGAYQTNNKGDVDGFITKISADKPSILASTYVGTSEYDQSFLVQTDEHNRIYVTGQTLGNFPVSNGVYANKNSGQFIAVFENDLGSLYLSTVFGSGRSIINISPSAFLVDLCGRIYVSGWGGEINSNHYHSPLDHDVGFTNHMPVTDDAYQQNSRDSSDFYLIILSRDLKSLVYGTYFGGNRSYEHVDGGTSRFDRDGKVYQSVCAGCGGFSDFPTTPSDVWSSKNNGKQPGGDGGCNNAVFKIDLNSSIYAPEFKDTTLVVTATDELYYSFKIVDKDVYDSIYVSVSGDIFDPKIVGNPVAELHAPNGMHTINGYIYWKPTCLLAKDTFIVYLTIRDNGCPTPRVTYGQIKIVIEAPAVPEPPNIFCLQRIGKDTLRLNWDEFAMGSNVSEYRLVKISPDGSESVIKTIKSKADQSFVDYAPDHQLNDYCYFIYGVGGCSQIGDSTRTVCSILPVDSTPPAIKMITVTVEDDSVLRVMWHKYPTEDFYEYQVYRKENRPFDKLDPNTAYILYRTIKEQNDTVLIDTNVNVHKKSYCYKVIMKNQCNRFSPDSTYGCSILLTGFAEPFVNNLSWNAYQLWKAGVDNYDIVRWDPTRNDSMVGFTDGSLSAYSDNKLDYNMGLYYYRVSAHEKNRGGKSTGATSVSNSIKLIQKPILHVPNVFTPNADSLNDIWNVLPTFVKDYSMKVYNRWGEKVWETDSKYDRWDGLKLVHRKDPFENAFIWQADYTGWDGSENYQQGYLNILW